MTFSSILHRFKKVLTTETTRWVPGDPELLDSIARCYAEANETDRLRLEEQFSFALHDVRMAGVWKRTNSRRLQETEEAILGLVSSEDQANCRILDIGASDGSTTVDLLERLRSHWGPGVSAVMSDADFWVERYKWGPLVEYRAASGEQVFVRIGRWRLRTAKLTRVAPSNLVKQIYPRLRSAGDRLYGRTWSLIGPRMRDAGRISLINPRATACRGLEPRALNCLIRDVSLLEAFHVVRASNVLNLGYFSPAELVVALSSAHAYLKEEGLLVISRSEGDFGEETEHGTAWIKAGQRFAFGRSFGRGSEINGLVDSFRAA